MNGTISINLESLLELSAHLNETSDDLSILNISQLSLMGKLRFIRSCVLLPQEKTNTFPVHLAKGKLEINEIPCFNILHFRKLDSANKAENELILNGFDYCLPIYFRKNLSAIICFGKRITETELTEEEIRYAEIVSAIAANALQNAKNLNSLITEKNNVEKQNQLLQTLFDLSYDFSSLLNKQEILRLLSFHLMGQLMVSRFAVFTVENNKIVTPIINRFDNFVSCEILNSIIEKKNSVTLSHDITDELRDCLVDSSIKVVSPMIIQGEVKGLLFVGKKMNNDDFSDDNIKFIEALGNTSISALENERLFQEELEKKRLESELEIALEIQKKLLPKELPNIPGFDISGISIPSRHVGGDYYDIIPLDGNKILITIADVAGKGIPAALLMSNVQAVLKTLSTLDLPLDEMINRLNYIITHNTTPDRFVTLFCGILDISEKTFKYINAGHNPPLVFKNGNSFITLNEGGMILGFSDEKFNYNVGKIQLEKGEIIIMYTDGVTESMNTSEKEYGEEKLKHNILIHSSDTAESLLKNIINSVRYHSEGVHQYDDITLVVLKAI